MFEQVQAEEKRGPGEHRCHQRYSPGAAPRAQTPAACVGVLGWLRPMVEQSHPAKSTSSASDLLMKAWIWAQENKIRVSALSLLSSSPSGAHPKSTWSNGAGKLYTPRREFSNRQSIPKESCHRALAAQKW